jgi:hypothetical protein
VINVGFKNLVLFLGALVVLFLSTIASWYEGAQILDNPWEWQETTIFSNWVNGEVVASKDILVVDHFVYAAKFAPTFPFLMVVSTLFIVFQITFWIFKGNKNIMITFFLILAVVLFVATWMLSSSPTTGLKLFSMFFGILSIISVLCSFLFKAKKVKCVDGKTLIN